MTFTARRALDIEEQSDTVATFPARLRSVLEILDTHTHVPADITGGTASEFLRGDGSWAEVPGEGWDPLLVTNETERAVLAEANLLELIENIAVGSENPVSGLVTDTDPTTLPGVTVTNLFLWYGKTTGLVQFWDDPNDVWVPIVKGPPALDAGDVAYDDATFPDVDDALDQLFDEHLDLDDTDHRIRTRQSETDPTSGGFVPNIGDHWTNPATHQRFIWKEDAGPAALDPAWQSLDGSWITTGTVDIARLPSTLVTDAELATAVSDAIGGLTPEDIADLTDLAAWVDANPDFETALGEKISITDVDPGDFYARSVIGGIVGYNAAELAALQAMTDAFAAKTMTRNQQTGSTYTLVLGDAGNTMVEMSSLTAQTLTIPTNASVAFPIGTTVSVLQTAAAGFTVVGASGVTVLAEGNKFTSAGRGAAVTLYKQATNQWFAFGNLIA